MQTYLIENEQVLNLDDDEYSDATIVGVELALKKGRASMEKDGRLDLLISYSTEIAGVLELKNGALDDNHLEQIEDYLSDTNEIVTQCPELKDSEQSPPSNWIGVLVGTSINFQLASKLEAGYKTEGEIPIAALIIRRFRGKDNNVYVATETIFKKPAKTKDYSKYQFGGHRYGKGRLVHAVIAKYVEDHPNIEFAGLQKMFPPELQGTLGVFYTDQKAIRLADEKRRRHFIKPDELIALADSVIAVCSQWGIGNINPFIEKARSYGYTIENVS